MIQETIRVNQEAYLSSKNGKYLDLVDMAIMEFIFTRWIQVGNILTIVEEDKPYIEISSRSILDAFPCFGIKTKNGIRRHLTKIEKLGYLELHYKSQELGMSLFHITDEFIAIKDYERKLTNKTR